MRPNIDYRFRVRTRNRVGLSEPSTSTTGTCSILATAPNSNPNELYVYGTAPNNLVIQWSTMPYIEHYASNLVYLLTVRCLDCNNIGPTDVNTTIISDWRTDRITYTKFQSGGPSNRITRPIESYKLFEVTIQSRNDKGTSTKVATLARGYSGENMPSIAASTPTVVQSTSDGAVLQWIVITQNQEAQVNGFFRGYRVEWCLASLTQTECERQKRFQDVLFQRLSVPISYLRQPRSVPEDEFDNIEGAYSYLSRFFYTSSVPHFEEGCYSDSAEGYCPSRAYQPQSVLGEAVQHVITRYTRQLVTTSTLADSVLSITPVTLRNFTWGEMINYTLTGAPGSTQIKAWLRVLNSLHAGPMSPTVTFQTLEGPPGPVSELKAVVIGTNRVNISWKAPTHSNGVITGYDFEAREIIGLDIALSLRYPTVYDGSLKWYEVTALRANTSYRLVVIPRTSAGLGIDCFIDVTTLDVTSTPSPPTFFISDITDTTFNVTFEPSHRGEPGSVFFVQYRMPGIILWQESLRVFLSRTFYVTQLNPSTEYEVRMVATNGALISVASESKYITTTGPAPPGGLEGSSAIWFAITIIIFIIVIFVFVLLVCIRSQRFKEVQEKAAPTEPLFEAPEMFTEPQSLASVEQQMPLNASVPYGSMGYGQDPPSHLASTIGDDNFERQYFSRQQPHSGSELTWAAGEANRPIFNQTPSDEIELSEISSPFHTGRVGRHTSRNSGIGSGSGGSGNSVGNARSLSRHRQHHESSVDSHPTFI